MYSLFLSIFSSTCFGCYLHPSSGARTVDRNKEYIKKVLLVGPLIEHIHKMCASVSSNFCLKYFSIYEEMSEILLKL
jgi:hypothetical protein